MRLRPAPQRIMGSIPIILFFLVTASGKPGQEGDFPVLKGPYFGQIPPGMTPEPFIHEVFAGDLHTTVVFSPDGGEAYWAAMETDLVFMHMENGQWTPPKAAPFTAERGVGEPFFSHDGGRLYFMSMQPVGEVVSPYDVNIWYVDRKGEGWAEPRPLCDEVNTMRIHWAFSLSENDELYFTASDDIYRTSLKDGECSKPVKLGEGVNTANAETTPFVAPDESYLIFSRVDESVSRRGDLYVSFKDQEGTWSKAKLMDDLNTEESHELWPFVTYDGRYLFFLRNTGPKADLKPFWVSSQVIERLR